MRICEFYANNANCQYSQLVDWHIISILASYNMLSKIREFVKKYQADLILLIGVILISLFSFFLGYIVAKIEEKEPIKIENPKSEIRNSKQILVFQIPNPKWV